MLRVTGALVEPAGIVAGDVTVTNGSGLETSTTAPPGGAGALNVTVAVTLLPLTTDAGFNVRFEATIGLTVRLRFSVELP